MRIFLDSLKLLTFHDRMIYILLNSTATLDKIQPIIPGNLSLHHPGLFPQLAESGTTQRCVSGWVTEAKEISSPKLFLRMRINEKCRSFE